MTLYKLWITLSMVLYHVVCRYICAGYTWLYIYTLYVCVCITAFSNHPKKEIRQECWICKQAFCCLDESSGDDKDKSNEDCQHFDNTVGLKAKKLVQNQKKQHFDDLQNYEKQHLYHFIKDEHN